MINGFLLVNKSVGCSSFYIVNQLRRVTNIQKIGHAGTLDPFSSGLLIIALRRENTKRIDHFQQLFKTYHVRLVLGIETDTLDSFGKVIAKKHVHKFSDAYIKSVLTSFLGEQSQVPPIFSAKKIDGKRSYNLARKGQSFSLEPVLIHIYSLTLLQNLGHTIDLAIQCSKGTYIRSLVRDIAIKLGTVGYAKNLVRVSIGDYHIKDALSISQFDNERIEKECFNV